MESKVTKVSEHLKMHGSSICLGRLKELETPHQQLGARICTGYHQINNFDDERMELVGDKNYGQVDALIAYSSLCSLPPPVVTNLVDPVLCLRKTQSTMNRPTERLCWDPPMN